MFKPANPLALTFLVLALSVPACSLFKSTPDDSTTTSDDTSGTEDSPHDTSPDDSASQGRCGWVGDQEPPGYFCGGSGEDPGGVYPIQCPDGLVEFDVCGQLTGEGCCDANGNNWYCGDDGTSQYVVFEECP